MVDKPVGLENDICECGRYKWKLHCPTCGSSECYAFSPNKRVDTVTRPNGQIAYLTVYRCRKCASTFNDDDWRVRCAAPHQRLGRRPLATPPVERQRVNTKLGDLSEAPPNMLQNALTEILKKRGIKPDGE